MEMEPRSCSCVPAKSIAQDLKAITGSNWRQTAAINGQNFISSFKKSATLKRKNKSKYQENDRRREKNGHSASYCLLQCSRNSRQTSYYSSDRLTIWLRKFLQRSSTSSLIFRLSTVRQSCRQPASIYNTLTLWRLYLLWIGYQSRITFEGCLWLNPVDQRWLRKSVSSRVPGDVHGIQLRKTRVSQLPGKYQLRLSWVSRSNRLCRK